MSVLILGLVIFLGVHSIRLFAADWRERCIERLGKARWMGLYSLVSVVGLGLIIWGFGQARMASVQLWVPPLALRHLTLLLMVPVFILLVAPHVPGNHFKAWLGHPMILGVKLWALAHLLANGRLCDLVLFGAFLLWAILDFRAARQRPEPRVEPRPGATLVTLAVGLVAYGVFALWLHQPLIGVPVI